MSIGTSPSKGKKVMPKEIVFELHQDLWNWLADHPKQVCDYITSSNGIPRLFKNAYFESNHWKYIKNKYKLSQYLSMNDNHVPHSLCWFCEAADIQRRLNNPSMLYSSCVYCIADWAELSEGFIRVGDGNKETKEQVLADMYRQPRVRCTIPFGDISRILVYSMYERYYDYFYDPAYSIVSSPEKQEHWVDTAKRFSDACKAMANVDEYVPEDEDGEDD